MEQGFKMVPDFVPFNYHLFVKLKKFLRGTWFEDSDSLMNQLSETTVPLILSRITVPITGDIGRVELLCLTTV